MWVVAELDDDYIAKMEEVLEVYERPYDPQQPVICFDEKSVTLHWLNQAEIEIGLFARQCLGRRRIPTLKMLRREAQAWNRRMNRARVKINWKFDRRAARRKFCYKSQSFTRSKT